ncbi:SH3 and multiple ankyrin repeat domains protein 2 [Arthrobotrys conoides]|uniref:SH3 and multiple ankyrin repeat domains protein 2 n=1 Tax=Arthrobotrys conoides TaxID=74498 RepID=A0AAN8NDM8_9PEZI
MASKTATKKRLAADAYTVGIIYAKPLEYNAIMVMMDESHECIPLPLGDNNEYTLGRIGDHNVIVAGPAKGMQGKASISSVVARIPFTFRNVKFGLLVGIGGGVPRPEEEDVRLGDVVVGAPEYGPAVIQYDLGKKYTNETEVSRTLNKPPDLLLGVVNKVDTECKLLEEGQEDFFSTNLQRFQKYPHIRNFYRRPKTLDRLFHSAEEPDLSRAQTWPEQSGSRNLCTSNHKCQEIEREQRDPGADIRIHHSTILSGDMVIKSAKYRDTLSAKHNNALCFEMEAAGVMDVFPCLVVRGISDYCDSHKNKVWQGYAAATAASYARKVLLTMAKREGNDSASHVKATEAMPAAPAKVSSPDPYPPIVQFKGGRNSGMQFSHNTGNIMFGSALPRHFQAPSPIFALK